MFFAQYYLDCLSQASYLIADETTGRAVVVDPRRDVDEYLAEAEARGFTVEGVINTHFHADFLSGHLELAARTGAWIGYGRRAETEYPIRKLAEGERISLGEVVLEIMETPGHTPESISVLVRERAADPVPYGVLTGDALFVGDVGRPDLLASVGVTADRLGRMLYDSVQHKLMALPDEVRVFPAHGAGSACGKNLSTERQSTIGQQRATNYACAPMTEDEFVGIVTAGQPTAPGYFGYDADLNRRDRELFDAAALAVPLDADAFLARRADGVVVVDARDPLEFAAGHLAGAVNVPADGRFAEQSGTVLDPAWPLLVIAPRVASRRPSLGSPGSASTASPATSPTPRPPSAPSPSRCARPPAAPSPTCAPNSPAPNRRWSSTSAARASAPRAASPAPSISRWPNSRTASARYRRTAPSWCTAPAATAPPSRPACCATTATRRPPTCSAATAPGPPRPEPADRAAAERGTSGGRGNEPSAGRVDTGGGMSRTTRRVPRCTRTG
ncbi:glyoxylase-like metal-dependent hydrolase (beta-lactamase superfamily II) [Kitasatospora cineracea]|uniref:Glyoxylase-like metal-dependent hydrolase (Beta-lactamase superfamily II) n=1 Tax=Kitasatospora cineracea TaxID=88074 RepID=A0A8G1U8X5_9ACTN|nr:glyoxylase-like metal-dependent hydrolase (beta-lactamase superfamily II) [Kitasatospora cineracea]